MTLDLPFQSANRLADNDTSHGGDDNDLMRGGCVRAIMSAGVQSKHFEPGQCTISPPT
jgi:hypothetical protein